MPASDPSSRRRFGRHRRRRSARLGLADPPDRGRRARALPPTRGDETYPNEASAAERAPPEDPRPPLPVAAEAQDTWLVHQPSGAHQSVGWDEDAVPTGIQEPPRTAGSLPAQILSVLSEPGVASISVEGAARTLGQPRADVRNAIEALQQAGELQAVEGMEGPTIRYRVPADRKEQLEAMFHEASIELGETSALARHQTKELFAIDDEDEPRLPVTAGLLSVFLPGTGQLLNGDVVRAAFVFTVWSLALVTNLTPILAFICLYAGAEAFFTSMVRGKERRLALEAATHDDKQTAPDVT